MTKEKRNKFFLCIGNKGKDKCIFSDVKVIDRFKPLWASSINAEKIKSLSIYCNFQHKFIVKLLTRCEYYGNVRLDKFINGNSIKLGDEKCVQ